jgi:hypothetical protein
VELWVGWQRTKDKNEEGLSLTLYKGALEAGGSCPRVGDDRKEHKG